MSPELDALFAQIREKRGPPERWLEGSMTVTRFLAGLTDSTRVFCRGEVRLDKGHFPAALTYNPIYKQTLAWAPSGKKGAMEGRHESFFHSNVPHVSIAREVLSGPETSVQIGDPA